jgi:putative transposase
VALYAEGEQALYTWVCVAHYPSGYAFGYDPTGRCHKKEFLLNFARDRRRYLQWLFEAKKRFGLSVLNYMVTSNHVHLLVKDNGERDVIPNSIQLIAGRTGQEFNQRKNRKGAYWEDRYHATAVETDSHLIQCLLYIDLNMVRAGVVRHPSEWPFSGYNEIQRPRERYAMVDYEGLRKLLNFKEMPDLAGKWSESIAMGSESFVMMTKEKLGIKAKGREVVGEDGSYALRESPAPYNSILGHENDVLRPENAYFWDHNLWISTE